jgi:hypothetical protein
MTECVYKIYLKYSNIREFHGIPLEMIELHPPILAPIKISVPVEKHSGKFGSIPNKNVVLKETDL